MTDIADRKALVRLQGRLSAFGSALGLAFGYIFALVILVAFGPGSDASSPPWHGRFITVSFVTGIVVILIGCVVLCAALKESIPKDERPTQMPWSDANPCMVFYWCCKGPLTKDKEGNIKREFHPYLSCILAWSVALLHLLKLSHTLDKLQEKRDNHT